MPGPSNSSKRKKKSSATSKKLSKKSSNDRTHHTTRPLQGKPSVLTGRLSPPELSHLGPPPVPPPLPEEWEREVEEQAEEQTSRGRSGGPPSPSTHSTPPPAHQRAQDPPSDPPQHSRSDSLEESSGPPSPLLTPPPYSFLYDDYALNLSVHNTPPSKERIVPEEYLDVIEKTLNKPPFIHDPGNGPRVRDAKAFLKSEFFAQAPALDDPVCAEFARPEVLQMLQTVLPEETALILWYNKSRATGRICPACQRLYRLGDTLPEHEVGEGGDRQMKKPPAQLRREQEISGFCSPVCFVLASFTFPKAIKGAWGKMAEDIDDEAWELLNSSNVRPRHDNDVSYSLGMIVRMTRLQDLGLGQLCFSPEELESEFPANDADRLEDEGHEDKESGQRELRLERGSTEEGLLA